MSERYIDWHQELLDRVFEAELARRDIEMAGIMPGDDADVFFFFGYVAGFRAALNELDRIAAVMAENPIVRFFNRHAIHEGGDPREILMSIVRDGAPKFRARALARAGQVEEVRA
ncbi:hypothetical protein [Caldinitratiruptor microaerophilus]|uniref:Uncharacterized protein n=1 Tax=Caldinitratiruptor microaerophilus TaxID=671077 RepID=A0AA35CN33_9FIRM|nr:hypothetical protein [Caldinitratiruptor microaerophilus]BDG62340.1 hypothetical protein caldi_34300 [Caldinitratiruptor microaerophilus]